jgi:hypothetical protein
VTGSDPRYLVGLTDETAARAEEILGLDVPDLDLPSKPGDYPKGIKISDREIKNLEKQNVLRRHDFHGEWNYCLVPGPT